ncbi:hypothetical protein GCM10010466_65010 [Planomonospora alba]|uniref:Knr4/Smi1-like domain-containing protein n=1 Tax=Planomonospora alba TaxID=161354 RepID=A0ABP6P2J4_9ACTN
MRRLITLRWVRLALAAGAAAAAVAAAVAAVRLRSRPAPPGARRAPGTGTAGGGAARRESSAAGTVPEEDREGKTAEPWPPVPVLGTPTAADLARYARRPYEPRPLPPRRPPLDGTARRRPARWGSAAAALCLLAVAATALESAVFSEEAPEGPAYVEEHYFSDDQLPLVLADRDCTTPVRLEDGRLHARCTAATPGPDRAAPGGDGAAGPPGEPGSLTAVRSGPDRDCGPRTAAPVVRRIDPEVTRAVNRQWARIERWLRANAPATHRSLARPARARTIAVAEAQMGLRFPDDLRASLLRHDGFPHFLRYAGVGVRGIRDTWRSLCASDGVDTADPRTDRWDGRMIPVGADGLGNHLVVDSVRRDVGETGHGGAVSFTPGGVRIRSYHALLRTVADALEGGGSVGRWRPVARDGALGWEIEGEE